MSRLRTLPVDIDPLAAVAAALIVAATASPWALGFSDNGAAIAAHIAFLMGIAPIAILVTALPAAAVVTGLAGVWLAAGPWIVGYHSGGTAAWAADLALGLALAAVAGGAWRARGEQVPRRVLLAAGTLDQALARIAREAERSDPGRRG